MEEEKIMVDEVTKMKQEHLNNYKKVVEEVISNNTKSLFQDDINLLLEKPPLDSMDLIKSKLLSLGKKYNIILDTEVLEKALEKYRNSIKKEFVPIQKLRQDELIKSVHSFEPVKKLDVIKINKKRFSDINKKLKKEAKKVINDNIQKYILKDPSSYISNKQEDLTKEKKFIDDFSKYMLKKYPKQILENIELKILVKDTTLINGIKEQGERYLFTNNNSYIFKEN